MRIARSSAKTRMYRLAVRIGFYPHVYYEHQNEVIRYALVFIRHKCPSISQKWLTKNILSNIAQFMINDSV